MDRPVEMKPNSEAGINGRLRAPLTTTHEVSKRERLTNPVENLDLRGWKSSGLQLRLELTNE